MTTLDHQIQVVTPFAFISEIQVSLAQSGFGIQQQTIEAGMSSSSPSLYPTTSKLLLVMNGDFEFIKYPPSIMAAVVFMDAVYAFKPAYFDLMIQLVGFKDKEIPLFRNCYLKMAEKLLEFG